MNEQISREIDAALAALRHGPRATSIHEAISPVAQQIHAFEDAARTYLPESVRGQWKTDMRAVAIKIAALAIKAIEDLRLDSTVETSR